QRPLSHVGLDFEFESSHAGVPVKWHRGHAQYWHDPHSVVPVWMALALVEHDRGGADRLFRYVIDCHRPGAVTPLAGVLRLPVLFTTHCVKEALFCLWSLGLPEPARVWDTWVAERAFRLGVHHPRYLTDRPRDEIDEADARDRADEAIE